jgi:polysaccharide pyruvyl transferase CsaB
MNISIIGNYGANNLGDELILEGLLKTIRGVKPAAKITVLSANPAQTSEKFDIRSVRKFPAGFRSIFAYLFNGQLSKTIKAVKKSDFVIIGGGGLFDDSQFRAVWIWSIQAATAYLLKRKVIMYGQSIKPIKSKLAQKCVKKLFKKAKFIAVRDEDSKKVLKKLIRGKKIYLMPDLIFKLEPKFEQAKDNKILFCLRDYAGKPDDFDTNLAKFINHILKKDKNLKIEFIPFKKELDEKYIATILEKITEKDRTHIHKFTEKRREVERIFTTSKVVIGMRLHSILMAIVTRTPFIAINYNPKVRNILETLRLQKFVIEPGEVGPKELESLLDTAENYHPKENTIQTEKHSLVEEKLKVLLD